MSPTLGQRALASCFLFLPLPSLAPVAADQETEAAFAATADSLLAGVPTELPAGRLDFLRWLAENRPVVFHGSPHADLSELSTERKSRDTTAWGDQQAVYASTDPVWAIYFACLRRDTTWKGTRNGTIGKAGGPLYPRKYFFLHNRGSASPDRFGAGSLYILPPETFVADKPSQGLDSAHLVSHSPVVPLARVDVTPEDFPFRDRVTYFRNGESMTMSLMRASLSGIRRNRPQA